MVARREECHVSEIKGYPTVDPTGSPSKLPLPDIRMDQSRLNPDKNFETIDPDRRIETSETDEAVQAETADNSGIEYRICRNENLAGDVHPITGVPFETKIVEIDGVKIEVVVPRFDSQIDVQLPKELYKASDKEQFDYCNEKLKEEIKKNPELRAKFDETQLQQIEDGKTPEGFVWHHNEEQGKMQLVDAETHQKTGHTGGKSLWGGGSDYR